MVIRMQMRVFVTWWKVICLCCGYVLGTSNSQLGLQFIMCNYFILQFLLKLAAAAAVPYFLLFEKEGRLLQQILLMCSE